MAMVFISYRDKDAKSESKVIFNIIKSYIGDIAFRDHAIPPGSSYINVLKENLRDAKLLLAIISNNWVNAGANNPDENRLLNEGDWVRKEISTAYSRNIPVVAVLLDGADLPDQLPEDIEQLRDSQQLRIYDSDSLHDDGSDEVKKLNRIVSELTRDNQVNTPSDPLTGKIQDTKYSPAMILLKPGKFMMGSNESEEDRDENEGPRHLVSIDCYFYIGIYPVKNREWKEYLKDCPNVTSTYTEPAECLRGDHKPVVNVTWNDANNYVEWLSQKTRKKYRLLTESEWEYAARAARSAGSKSGLLPYYSGTSINRTVACFNGKGFSIGGVPSGDKAETTAVVGKHLPANGFGLYDMHGNVWEWVQDAYHCDYEGAPDNGASWGNAGEQKNKYGILRGGSWRCRPGFLRSACRHKQLTSVYGDDIGFRVARDVK
ncbi:MAG: SUMF1/EgtB/PvdO family nonheme iron enzyme [Sedimenticola sp.]